MQVQSKLMRDSNSQSGPGKSATSEMASYRACRLESKDSGISEGNLVDSSYKMKKQRRKKKKARTS